tara:strand:+ start:221 stop:466 length:246 start_codon:yes stop_codon:yes gene_type:complete
MNKMKKTILKSIKCSRCDKTFNGGLEYREHFYTHLKEWEESEDRAEYIKQTTNPTNSKCETLDTNNIARKGNNTSSIETIE